MAPRVRLHPARTFARYVAALAICLFVLGVVYDLGPDALEWPFAYRGDTMVYQLLTKNLTDTGRFLDVPLLGAPDWLNLRDIPTSDNSLHLLLLRLISLGTSHYPVVLNGFFLLGFVLVFVSAFAVLRHFGVAWWTSVCASLLHAFAPFHILRGEHHLFLSAYWQVPLAVLLALWASREGIHAGRSAGPGFDAVRRNPKVWLSILICLVLSSTGFYYAFFACYFLFVAGLVAGSRDRSWRHAAVALGLVALICGGLAVNLSPTLLRFQSDGPVPLVQREAGDADFYGLRLAQLLLPVRGHVLRPLDELRADYSRRPLVNENDDVSLGLVGALGFLGLLWWFVFRKPPAEGLGRGGASGLLDHLSIFSLAAVLLATIGGFGSLVAFFGLPQVRAYNRIGVFLSFIALFAVAVWVDRAARRFATTPVRKRAFRIAVGIATVAALFDQISPGALPNNRGTRPQFASDAAFVRGIEEQVPHGASIFQLPFEPYPESPPKFAMKGYDLLRGYLHSNHLRWSYGTVRGREGNSWLRSVAALPVDQLLDTLVWAGFSGIYIDRHGFADGADSIQRGLDAALATAPLYSADRELVFYSLQRHRARLERDTPTSGWEAKRDAALHPPLVVWREGFYSEESDDHLSWRWAKSPARLTLINRTSLPQAVRLRLKVTPNVGGRVTIRSPLFGQAIQVERHQPFVEQQFSLQTGQHDVVFESDAPRLSPPDDFRVLVFEVRDLQLRRLADSGG